MDRSRSKRNHYHDDQDIDNDTGSRNRARYNHYYYPPGGHRPRGGVAGNRNPSMQQRDSSSSAGTSYSILCRDEKVGSVIGKSGSIIKSIRQHTGAWINVHDLISADEERIIEISDARRRDLEGRVPAFSPAQEALFMVHDRIVESDAEFLDEGYGSRGVNGGRLVMRLVVSKLHVGCLMGKGGKIIEQMRAETNTQIRILPRDHTLPRCVSSGEEIVQVVGDVNAVRNALAIISSRLRESQCREPISNLHRRAQSLDWSFSDDDAVSQSHINATAHRFSTNGPSCVPRMPSPNYSNGFNLMWSCGASALDTDDAVVGDRVQPFHGEDLVFKLLCPSDKVDEVVGEVSGIVDLLQNEVGVAINIIDPVSGSDEQIFIISSSEGPDDELFPAQEALLHIQTRIIDVDANEDDTIKTRLLIPSSDATCLEGRDGSLSEMETSTGAKIKILLENKLPTCVSGDDQLLQIEGEIMAAREALVEVTSRLRSYFYRDFCQNSSPPASRSDIDGAASGIGGATPNGRIATLEGLCGSDHVTNTNLNAQFAATVKSPKDAEKPDFATSAMNRISVPIVTRSILEVVIPEHAVSLLIRKSKNKLAQIGELSGANVTLMDDRPQAFEKIIQISGTPDQAERAQSLLQGFILSTQEDGA